MYSGVSIPLFQSEVQSNFKLSFYYRVIRTDSLSKHVLAVDENKTYYSRGMQTLVSHTAVTSALTAAVTEAYLT